LELKGKRDYLYLGGSQKASCWKKMFPFVFSKCQPQWKNIKTAKYKTCQHGSVSMVSILYVYVDCLLGLMMILINLYIWKPYLPQNTKVLKY
jgi:hypothetical protein